MRHVCSIRFSALAVLVAFLLSAFMPFLATYHPMGMPTGSAALGESILICTGDGFRWVKVADLASGKESPRPHPGYKCPLCYSTSHGALHAPPPALAALPRHFYQARPLPFAHDIPFLPSLLAASLRVRAPPAPFVG